MDGMLVERTKHKHVSLRSALLDRGAVLPEPQQPIWRPEGRSGAEVPPEQWWATLAETGLALAEFPEPPADGDLAAFGRRLGTLMPETDPAVLPFVSREVILNLRSEHAATSDAALQPFARNSLTLHSESSARPTARQPRYIVLMCCDPGERGTSAQTVLVPMAAVAQRLSHASRDLLATTRYAEHPEAPYLVRKAGNRAVFSFRDPRPEPIRWRCDSAWADEGQVNEALLDLLVAMYDSPAHGIDWRRGLVVVIDNTFHFHGRTAGTGEASVNRHLKRLRVI